MFIELYDALRFEADEDIISLARKSTGDFNNREAIRLNVFNKFILDINNKSSNLIKIATKDLIVISRDNTPITSVRYMIPDSILQGRELLDVNYITSDNSFARQPNGTSTYGEINSGVSNNLITLASNTFGQIGGYNVHEIEVVSHNEFIVNSDIDGMVDITVTYSKTLSELTSRSTPHLEEGFTLLVKAWLLNKLKMKLNQGSIYYGHELPMVTEILSSYEGSIEKYKEFRSTVLGKLLFMDNSKSMSSFLKTMVPNN